ncbi:MAG TPA: Glu/Leu/Phe/Val dehydrogenase [Anaerolineales bacterium]|nr:Glu/Leu/Phe/Val dehydrogenase [Anaerolineales bacterium]
MTENGYSLLGTTMRQFDRAAEQLNLDGATRDLLRQPLRQFQFTIPVRMDDGSVRIFQAYRIQHNDARGPSKGGLRFHPQEAADNIRALAMLRTWACAVVDLPLGGSMGGIACDPHDLSQLEQERLCRGWVRQLAQNLGPTWDVPGPDLRTSSQHMLWMLDEYETLQTARVPGFVTGKPVGMGGSLGRKEANGYGVIITVREALRDMDLSVGDTTASVQGFGNVAQHAIALYHQLGGRVECVSCWDHQSGASLAYRKRSGIELQELQSISNSFGEIDRPQAEARGYEVLPGEAWLEQEVDLLIPAALETQITAENAGRIGTRVKIIAEGASAPITPDAAALLQTRGVLVIPDVLASAGGLVCSYFEQVQGNMNYYWRQDEVLGKLDVQMTDAYLAVRARARDRSLGLREAAHVIAVARVAQACQERGWT